MDRKVAVKLPDDIKIPDESFRHSNAIESVFYTGVYTEDARCKAKGLRYEFQVSCRVRVDRFDLTIEFYWYFWRPALNRHAAQVRELYRPNTAQRNLLTELYLRHLRKTYGDGTGSHRVPSHVLGTYRRFSTGAVLPVGLL